jgi:hypothetical protein
MLSSLHTLAYSSSHYRSARWVLCHFYHRPLLTLAKSVWGINNQLFSLSALAIVIPSVALFTYTVVLNLNNISRLFNAATTYISSPASPESPSLLRRFIDSQVCRMQHDREQIWRDRGGAFSRSWDLRVAGTTPSRWRIVQYSLRQVILKTSYALASTSFFTVLLPQPLRDRWRERRAHGGERNHPPSLQNQVSRVHLRDIHVQVDVETVTEPVTDIPFSMRDPSSDKNELTPDIRSSHMLSNISHVIHGDARDWSGRLAPE